MIDVEFRGLARELAPATCDLLKSREATRTHDLRSPICPMSAITALVALAAVRTTPPLSRRAVLTRGVAAAGTFAAIAPASAGLLYTIVPTGSIADKEKRLAEVDKLFAKTPDDPYVFGERAQLQSDIKRLGVNKNFAGELSGELAAGSQRFIAGLTVPVPEMEPAVRFWIGGLGAQVLSTRLVGGANVTRVAFGTASLARDDGAKFVLELVERRGAVVAAADDALQYLQLALPVFRISQAMAYGGNIESAYGWTSLTAPGGLPLRVRIEDTRRDPFELVALRTADLAKATKHYEALGMRVQGETTKRGFKKISVNMNSLFEDGDAFEPDREVGARQLGYGDPILTTSVLLLPPSSRRALRESAGRLAVVGAPPPPDAGAEGACDGVETVFVPASEIL